MKRDFAYDILPLIQTRWSPRAFAPLPLTKDELMPLFEAARYAPSCYNEQPWRFVLASSSEELTAMQELLSESNRLWAKNAGALVLILAQKTFELDGKENPWHMFDAGAAWGYLSLEAEKRGLQTHCMGGFSKKKAQEFYRLGEKYAPIAIVAIGKPGDVSALPHELKEREHPGTREPLASLFYHP